MEIVLTQGTGHAQQLSRTWAQRGDPVRIYACGGDGTLNEVVNGAAGFENAAVTNVPRGTGNDFLKIFGPDFRSAFSDLAALADGPQAPFDLMECGGRLGLGIVCAGVDARVAAGVHGYKRIPCLPGPGAYVLARGVNVLFKPLTRPMVIEADGQRLEGETTILCICNGRHYGGGFMPVGDAMPDDGILDTLVVPKVTRRTFFRLVGQYAKGHYRDYPQVIRDFHGREVSFSSPRELVVVIDGEVLRGNSFCVRVSEKKLNFFWPPGVDYAPREI